MATNIATYCTTNCAAIKKPVDSTNWTAYYSTIFPTHNQAQYKLPNFTTKLKTYSFPIDVCTD